LKANQADMDVQLEEVNNVKDREVSSSNHLGAIQF